MNNLPFGKSRSGRFFRGNLHTHSNRSDGGMTPEQVCEAYRVQGYDFLSLTDHFLPEFDYPLTDTTAYRTRAFTTILGAELHAPALSNCMDWHILALGLPLDFGAPKSGETGPEIAARAIAAGAFVSLAHPAWYGATVADLQTIQDAHAIETYNAICGGLTDRAESWFHLDSLLSSGRRINLIAADDAHFRDFSALLEMPTSDDPSEWAAFETRHETAASPDGSGSGDTIPAGFSAWVWVHAERLDPELIVESLKAGRFYSSQGPVIHEIFIDLAQSELMVINSPAVSVYVVGSPTVMALAANHAPQITRTSFDIKAFTDSYCRVIVVDAAGKRAWSNPIWFDA